MIRVNQEEDMTRRTLDVRHRWRQSAVGTLLAIAVTTAMDAGGLSDFNAFPLLPLFVLFSYLQRLSRTEIGLTWGSRRAYGLALFYPALVLGLAGLIAWLSGAVALASTDWPKAWLNLAFLTLVSIPLALVTEEGFFRGWLWASLQRAGQTERGLLVWTSLAFAAWHASTALLPTEFRPPIAQVPTYLLNAAVIGLIWGLMRQRSGSIMVTAVSHGVWNGLAYAFFGFGTTLGALGIRNTGVFGPEVGLVGLALNLAFAAVLWPWYTRGRAIQAVEMTRPLGRH
jgi:membrane protease YdiL (CAAX protease family)